MIGWVSWVLCWTYWLLMVTHVPLCFSRALWPTATALLGTCVPVALVLVVMRLEQGNDGSAVGWALSAVICLYWWRRHVAIDRRVRERERT